MKKRFIVYLILLAVLFSSGISLAKVDIYVRNQPFNFQQVVQQGEIYVPLEPLLKALGFGWKEIDGAIGLYFQEKGLPCPEIGAYEISFKWNGKVIPLKYVLLFGKIYTPIKDSAKKLEAAYLYNSKTNILDVLYPNSGASSAAFASTTVADSASSKPAQKTEEGKTPEGAQDMVKAELKYHQDYLPTNQAAGGDVRGTVTVTNTSDKPVEGVIVTVNISDQEGKDLHKQIYNIGNMAAGAAVDKDFYWSNPNPLLAIKHTIDVDYKGKNEQKKD